MSNTQNKDPRFEETFAKMRECMLAFINKYKKE